MELLRHAHLFQDPGLLPFLRHQIGSGLIHRRMSHRTEVGVEIKEYLDCLVSFP